MNFAQGLVLLVIFGSLNTILTQATELPSELNFTDDGASGGSGTRRGGSIAPAGPTAAENGNTGTSSGPIAISVPCLTEDGKVAGATSATVCPAILPKCSDLRRDVEKGVKGMLSLKIWGYYNGKDLDLDKSTLDKMEGVDIPSPLCSVVGHTLQYRAVSNDLEISRQSIGKKLECGTRPHARGDQGSGGLLGIGAGEDRMVISFHGNEGGLWSSYMMGVYPWLIRKHANAVLTTLKPDFTNLSEIMKSNTAVRGDLATLNRRMTVFYQELTSEAKDVCTSGQSDLMNKCKTGAMSVTDPSNRLCTLVKAELAINGGALPNLLIQEIMTRVQNEYDSYFSGMLAHSKPEFNTFFKGCADSSDGNGFLGMQPRKKYSCVASCLFDGKDYYTWADYNTEESGDSGRSSRRCTMPGKVSLTDGQVYTSFNGILGQLNGRVMAINKGFAGFVEFLIRTKICGQAKPTDESACDKIGIPDKPENAK